MSKQQTQLNLEAAFAGESMANRKYLYFAKLARALGDEETAKLFEETAAQETHHAFGHLELLYPPAKFKSADLLRMAMEGELYETNQMYPSFAATARAEQNGAATKEFEEQGKESKEHAALFKDALVKAEKRFTALARVEAKHAARYGEALKKVEASKGGAR